MKEFPAPRFSPIFSCDIFRAAPQLAERLEEANAFQCDNISRDSFNCYNHNVYLKVTKDKRGLAEKTDVAVLISDWLQCKVQISESKTL